MKWNENEVLIGVLLYTVSFMFDELTVYPYELEVCRRWLLTSVLECVGFHYGTGLICPAKLELTLIISDCILCGHPHSSLSNC